MNTHIIIACVLSIVLSCASIQKKPGFDEVQDRISNRSGFQVQWNQGTEEDALVEHKVDSLLSNTLSLDAAVQITLLNNRRLKVLYQDLGIAQADVVQAGLLRNPVFSGGIGFPFDGSAPDLLFGASFNFLDFLYIPLRKSVSKAMFEAAKLRVSGAVLEKTAHAKMAYYKVQADQQNLELQKQIVAATEGSYKAAEKLYEAGNIIELNYRNEQALYERANIDLQTAQVQLIKSKEALNRMMGVSGKRTSWTIEQRLPLAEAVSYEWNTIEQKAIDASLDLASLGEEITAYGKVLGLTRREALFPQLELGVEYEREGDREIGPEASISIPLFDQGQAKNAKAVAQLRKKQHEYAAQMIEIQSRARELIQKLDGVKAIVHQYETTLLPLRATVTEQSQAQYNAMQIGVFQLLQAKQQEIEAGRSYIELLYTYWAIHTDLELLVQGRNSLLSNNIELRPAMMGASGNTGGH